jgi:hypothetical protein
MPKSRPTAVSLATDNATGITQKSGAASAIETHGSGAIRSLEQFERTYFPKPDVPVPFGGQDPQALGAQLAREVLAAAIAERTR